MDVNGVVIPRKLPNKFPTRLETLQAFLFEKEKWMKDYLSQKDPPNFTIANIVAQKIQRLYLRSGIKTIEKTTINQKVMKIYRSRLSLLKIPRSKRYTQMFLRKKMLFESGMAELLEVADKSDRTNRASKASKTNKLSDIDFSDDSDEIGKTDDENDLDFQINEIQRDTTNIDLSEIVEVKSRYSYSDRGTAAIVNATLRTFQINRNSDNHR